MTLDADYFLGKCRDIDIVRRTPKAGQKSSRKIMMRLASGIDCYLMRWAV
jgi:hypothetical protein